MLAQPSPGPLAQNPGGMPVSGPGRSNAAQFFTRQRFAEGQAPAPSTGYADQESRRELYSLTGTIAGTLGRGWWHGGGPADAPPAEAPAPTGVAQAWVQVGAEVSSPRFLHSDFAAAVTAALPADPTLGPLASAAQAHAGLPVDSAGAVIPAGVPLPRSCFVWREHLLFRRGPRGDRLGIQSRPDLFRLVLENLHATPLGGHFDSDKTLALARRTVW